MSRECAIAGCNFIEVDGDPVGLMGMHMAAAHKEPCGHAIRVRDCVGCERMHAMPIGSSRDMHSISCDIHSGEACSNEPGCPRPEPKHAGPVDLHSVVQPGDHDHFATYKVATIALRDAELALKAAQEGYRRALEALNKAIAPFPSEAL